MSSLVSPTAIAPRHHRQRRVSLCGSSVSAAGRAAHRARACQTRNEYQQGANATAFLSDTLERYPLFNSGQSDTRSPSLSGSIDLRVMSHGIERRAAAEAFFVQKSWTKLNSHRRSVIFQIPQNRLVFKLRGCKNRILPGRFTHRWHSLLYNAKLNVCPPEPLIINQRLGTVVP